MLLNLQRWTKFFYAILDETLASQFENLSKIKINLSFNKYRLNFVTHNSLLQKD